MQINKIHLGDCPELMKNISDNSINMILTNPLYGIKTILNEIEKYKNESMK